MGGGHTGDISRGASPSPACRPGAGRGPRAPRGSGRAGWTRTSGPASGPWGRSPPRRARAAAGLVGPRPPLPGRQGRPPPRRPGTRMPPAPLLRGGLRLEERGTGGARTRAVRQQRSRLLFRERRSAAADSPATLAADGLARTRAAMARLVNESVDSDVGGSSSPSRPSQRERCPAAATHPAGERGGLRPVLRPGIGPRPATSHYAAALRGARASGATAPGPSPPAAAEQRAPSEARLCRRRHGQ